MMYTYGLRKTVISREISRIAQDVCMETFEACPIKSLLPPGTSPFNELITHIQRRE